VAPEPLTLRLELADTPWKRFRGLIGRRELVPGDAVLLRPCGSVHTCLMRFPIDVVFLDRDLTVLRVALAVPPWRLRAQRGARAVVELAAGEAERAGIGAGDRLVVRPCPPCRSSCSC
jgi:uncharacterized membrane protein (UPF0127 family)